MRTSASTPAPGDDIGYTWEESGQSNQHKLTRIAVVANPADLAISGVIQGIAVLLRDRAILVDHVSTLARHTAAHGVTALRLRAESNRRNQWLDTGTRTCGSPAPFARTTGGRGQSLQPDPADNMAPRPMPTEARPNPPGPALAIPAPNPVPDSDD